MFLSILKILEAGLSLWESKEKRKYIDKIADLKRQYYDETNKPAHERSDAVLDFLEFELRVVGTAFASDVGGEKS